MNCPNAPHVHLDLECPACLELRQYLFLRPDEEVNCLECRFPIPVPEADLKYARAVFELSDQPPLIIGPFAGPGSIVELIARFERERNRRPPEP